MEGHFGAANVHVQRAAVMRARMLPVVAASAVLHEKRKREMLEDDVAKNRRVRSCQTKHWLMFRPQYGHYENLLRLLRTHDQKTFYVFQRMGIDVWDEILQKISPFISKQDTNMRQAISPGARLAITLRFLATGIYILYLYVCI